MSELDLLAGMKSSAEYVYIYIYTQYATVQKFGTGRLKKRTKKKKSILVFSKDNC